MSLDIWTSCEGPNRALALSIVVHRVVEGQHHISTRKLVDSLEDQEVLEAIIDSAKPARPAGKAFQSLHYLLFTPFRHPPLENGSRFGGRDQRSLFYGAKTLEAALAEKSYYQLLFQAGSTGTFAPTPIPWTAFSVAVATNQGIDLTRAPFDRFRAQISSPSEYAASQALGRQMRAAGIEAFTYFSARCPHGGTNVGLFEPAFTEPSPKDLQTWQCHVLSDGCELLAPNTIPPVRHRFARKDFEVGGVLPAPAL